MGDAKGRKEHEDLMAAVGAVVESKLKLHHTANGYVSKPTFEASTKLLTKGMSDVTDAVERVHEEMGHQRKATEDLGRITGKLSTDLVAHEAKHAGFEKARGLRAQEESAKASRWKRWLAAAGLVATVLGMLGGLGTWLVSEVKAAKERPSTIVIDEEAAKEIAKAVNDRGEDP